MLENTTKDLIRQLFAGKVCCGCQRPAERISSSKYFCNACLTHRERYENVRLVRVFETPPEWETAPEEDAEELIDNRPFGLVRSGIS